MRTGHVAAGEQTDRGGGCQVLTTFEREHVFWAVSKDASRCTLRIFGSNRIWERSFVDFLRTVSHLKLKNQRGQIIESGW